MSRGPKDTVGSLSDDAGGILCASAPGLLPRNEKQVTNFKSRQYMSSRADKFMGKEAAADNLFVVMQQSYSVFLAIQGGNHT